MSCLSLDELICLTKRKKRTKKEEAGDEGSNKDDTIECDGSPICSGTDDADVICGTENSEEIRARKGDDIVCGFGGDDTLKGGWGADWLFGGDGDYDILLPIKNLVELS